VSNWNGTSITPRVETSFAPEGGGFWCTVGTLTALTGAGQRTAHIVDDLDLFTRVYLDVSSASGNFRAIMVLRPDPAN